MVTALIIVDVQKDFTEGGSLAVKGGADVATRIGRYAFENINNYDVIVTTRDYHIDPGDHFTEWPAHCVAGTDGSQYHPNLVDEMPGNQQIFTNEFRKGMHAAAYSGFEGTNHQGQLLEQFLRDHGVTEVDIVGIATDYCVKATALDAVKRGFQTRVLHDLTAAVADKSAVEAYMDCIEAGIAWEMSEQGESDGTS